jgi:hypothetical protein
MQPGSADAPHQDSFCVFIPAAFCPGWLADSMNATAEQRAACIPSFDDWLNVSLADRWVEESVRYLQSVHVDGANFDAEMSTPRGSVAVIAMAPPSLGQHLLAANTASSLQRAGEVYLLRRLTEALHAGSYPVIWRSQRLQSQTAWAATL